MDNPQSYYLSPIRYFSIGYGRLSTTERVLVNNDGLINLNWLKIQSDPDTKDQVALKSL